VISVTASIEALADFYTALQRDLQAASTVAQLEGIAHRLDTVEFASLPPQVREDIAELYAHRLFHITGGMMP